MADWDYKIHWNKPRNLRQKLTGLMHRLLDRIDGRMTVSVDYDSNPVISRREFFQCVRAGQKHAEMLLREIVTADAVDVAMREEQPELYGH